MHAREVCATIRAVASYGQCKASLRNGQRCRVVIETDGAEFCPHHLRLAEELWCGDGEEGRRAEETHFVSSKSSRLVSRRAHDRLECASFWWLRVDLACCRHRGTDSAAPSLRLRGGMVSGRGDDRLCECSVYGCGINGLPGAIRTVRPDGTRERRLARIGDSPAWSPSGNQIAYARNNDVWVMNADGTRQHQLTHTPKTEYAPTWSPDGRTIAYLRGRRDDDFASLIFTIRSDGRGGAKQRAFADWFSSVSWSPDGHTIVFSLTTRTTRGGLSTSVYAASTIDGRERRMIFGHTPMWNPAS